MVWVTSGNRAGETSLMLFSNQEQRSTWPSWSSSPWPPPPWVKHHQNTALPAPHKKWQRSITTDHHDHHHHHQMVTSRAGTVIITTIEWSPLGLAHSSSRPPPPLSNGHLQVWHHLPQIKCKSDGPPSSRHLWQFFTFESNKKTVVLSVFLFRFESN